MKSSQERKDSKIAVPQMKTQALIESLSQYSDTVYKSVRE